jgi:hypothetical protein
MLAPAPRFSSPAAMSESSPLCRPLGSGLNSGRGAVRRGGLDEGGQATLRRWSSTDFVRDILGDHACSVGSRVPMPVPGPVAMAEPGQLRALDYVAGLSDAHRIVAPHDGAGAVRRVGLTAPRTPGAMYVASSMRPSRPQGCPGATCDGGTPALTIRSSIPRSYPQARHAVRTPLNEGPRVPRERQGEDRPGWRR